VIHIRRIRTRGFLGHRETDIVLPDHGVVVVTGPNGAGKSSIIEAVASALWGKTIRGTPWWTDGIVAMVNVETDRVNVVRDRDGQKLNMVRWGTSASALKEFETATRGQEELDPIVGDMDAWRRASVFSSQDLLTFSVATDGERKRLLEGMLGLDVFDRGLTACRADIHSVKERVGSLDRRLGKIEARLEVERKRLSDAGEAVGPEPPGVDQRELDEAARHEKDARGERRHARDSINSATHFIATLERERAAAESSLASVAELDSCPSCGQPLTDDARSRLGQSARDKVEWAATRLPATRETLEASSADLEELDVELDVLTERLTELRDRAAVHREWRRRAGARTEKTDEVQAVVDALEADVATAQHDVRVAGAELDELKVVEKVLGLRGVRTHVVARAVRGLETVANAWLDRLCPGARVRLRPGKDARGGNQTNPHETIQFMVRGIGHDARERAYKAGSGGERRRVDVAMLLALAEVRAASAGTVAGTMWFDEVFDTLDDDGIAAVGEALRDVSSDRCVVVVTHSDDLAAELDAAARITIRDGVIES